MAYSFQTFTLNQVLTSAQMNQVEVNVRDHFHGRSNVQKVGISFDRTAKSSGFNVASTDCGELFDCTAALAVTFDASSSLGAGFAVTFYNSGTGNVTLTPNGAETISTLNSLTVGPTAGVVVYSDGSNLQALRFGGGALALLSTQTVSGSPSTIDFANLLSGQYDNYMLTYEGLYGSAGAVMGLRFGTGAGPTYASASYRYSAMRIDAAPTSPTTDSSTSTDSLKITGTGILSNTAAASANGVIWVFNANSSATQPKQAVWQHSGITSNSMYITGNGNCNDATNLGAVLTSLRLVVASGTFTAGVVRLYAAQNS